LDAAIIIPLNGAEICIDGPMILSDLKGDRAIGKNAYGPGSEVRRKRVRTVCAISPIRESVLDRQASSIILR